YGLFYYDFGDPILFELQTSQWCHLGLNSLAARNMLRVGCNDTRRTKAGSGPTSSTHIQFPATPSDSAETDDQGDQVTHQQQMSSSSGKPDFGKASVPSTPKAVDLPGPYAAFLAGGSPKATTTNLVQPRITFAQVAGSNKPDEDDSLLSALGYGEHAEAYLADLLTLLHKPSALVNKLVLPDLCDWQLHGLLDTEPLRVADGDGAVQTCSDCHLERGDLYLDPTPVSTTRTLVDVRVGEALVFWPEAYRHSGPVTTTSSLNTGHNYLTTVPIAVPPARARWTINNAPIVNSPTVYLSQTEQALVLLNVDRGLNEMVIRAELTNGYGPTNVFTQSYVIGVNEVFVEFGEDTTAEEELQCVDVIVGEFTHSLDPTEAMMKQEKKCQLLVIQPSSELIDIRFEILRDSK
ncbi:hypothetical protein AHF37_08814, partial [Paragonimus kellicotti]